MTVEAQQMNLLPSHLIRDLKPSSHLLSTQMDSGSFFPLYQSKRPRDSFDPIPLHQKINKLSSLIDNNDMILQIQQNQSEIDCFVAQHVERVRMEVEKRRRVESRMVAVEMYKGIARKLREKDEEIERIRKLNWGLQERLKRLCVENQLWRDLAHANEAAANSLRANLQQQQLVMLAQEEEGAAESSSCSSSGTRTRGRCSGCGEKESCVLVLPCRHLCLCTSCGSTTHTCPLCNSPTNATVHLNLS